MRRCSAAPSNLCRGWSALKILVASRALEHFQLVSCRFFFFIPSNYDIPCHNLIEFIYMPCTRIIKVCYVSLFLCSIKLFIIVNLLQNFLSIITSFTDIIALLNRVLATMTSREEDNVEQENKPIFYSQLWDLQPLKPSKYWFLKTGENILLDTYVLVYTFM